MKLHGLDEVQWESLRVDFGLDARRVPFLLQQLATGTTAEATQALTELRRTVSAGRQCSEAAPPTIPFLAQVLTQRDEVGLRRLLVELLHELGAGPARALFPAPPPRPCFEPEPPEDEDDGEFLSPADKAQWQLECHVSVELLLPAVLPLLEDVNDGLVSATIALLASFPEAAALTTPALWKLAREEDDSPLGGQALVALAYLRAPGVADAARVTFDAHQGSPLAFWAATADVLASPAPSAIALHQVFGLPRAQHRQPCPFTGTVARLQRRVLGRLPRASVTHAIAAVSSHPDFVSELEGARCVVRWAASSTGDDRRRALTILAQRGPWGLAAFVRLLEEYGFPTAPHALLVA
ncbi:MAG: hypothetical protein ACOZQL_05095 [Myxococcota bacterium]